MLNNLLNHNLLHITWLSNSLSPSLNATYSHGINKSANVRFPQRLSVIFGFRRDYPPWKMASCRDCPCDLASSLCRKLFSPSTTISAGSKRSRTVSAETKYDRQSLWYWGQNELEAPVLRYNKNEVSAPLIKKQELSAQRSFLIRIYSACSSNPSQHFGYTLCLLT